jgi:hypothetical protein
MRLYGSWQIEYGINLYNGLLSTDIKTGEALAGFRPRTVGVADLWVRASFGSSLTILSPTSYRYRFFLILTAFNTTTSFTLADITQHPDLPLNREWAESGTYEIAVDMEEFWYHEDGRFTAPDAVSRLATPHDTDDVPTRRIHVSRVRVGGNVSAKITSGRGQSLDSRTITSTHLTSWGSLESPYASGSASTTSKVNIPTSGTAARRLFETSVATCSGFLELASGAAALTVPTFSAGPNAAGGSASQGNATAGLGTGSGDVSGSATFNASVKPVQRHRLTADLRSGNGSYASGSWDILVQTGSGSPSTLETVTITGGRLDRTYTRDARQVTLTVLSTGSTTITAERLSGGTAIESPTAFPEVPSLVIAAASLTAHGVPLSAPRMLLRGRSWLSRRLGQAATYSYGRTGAAGAWESSRVTAETNITKSITGGVLRLVASSGFAGGKAATLDSQSQRAEFRYHHLKWRRVDAGTGTMQIRRGEMSTASDPMVWDCPAAGTGTWATSTRDVFAPDDSVPNVVGGSTSPDVVTGTLVEDWEIHLPAGAGTWEIDYLEGSRQSFSQGTLLSAPMPGLSGELDACTDGMSLSDWEGASWRESLAITPSVSKPWYPLAAPWPWGSWTWGNSGPDITDMSFWYDSDLGVSYYEGGDGMLLDGDVLSIPSAIDLRQGASSGTDPALTACDLLERATVYPGAGDVFFESGGGFGETVTFRFGTLLGPRAVGVVRLVGGGTMPQVEARNNGTALTGPATPGSEGFFVVPATLERSGASPGAHDLRLTPETDTGQRFSFVVGTGSGEYKDRDTVYTLWRVEAPSEGLAVAVSPTGRAVRAFVEDGTIRLEFLSAGGASWGDGVDTGISGTSPALAIRDLSGDVRLTWDDAGSIKGAISDDEGRTTAVATILTGPNYSRPDVAADDTGREHHIALYMDSGTRKIRTRVLDAQGTEVVAPVAIVSSDVADDQPRIFFQKDELKIMYRASSSGNIITLTNTSGDYVTFV